MGSDSKKSKKSKTKQLQEIVATNGMDYADYIAIRWVKPKRASHWQVFVREYSQRHPNLSGRALLKAASAAYKSDPNRGVHKSSKHKKIRPNKIL